MFIFCIGGLFIIYMVGYLFIRSWFILEFFLGFLGIFREWISCFRVFVLFRNLARVLWFGWSSREIVLRSLIGRDTWLWGKEILCYCSYSGAKDSPFLALCWAYAGSCKNLIVLSKDIWKPLFHHFSKNVRKIGSCTRYSANDWLWCWFKGH